MPRIGGTTDALEDAANDVAPLPRRRPAVPAVLRRRPMVLITGGSGFLGASLADRVATAGERVLIYDNLARPGVVRNLEWLQYRHGHRVETAIADVRDADALRETLRQASAVFHLAAATDGVDDPATAFETNARGALNVLEAARRRPDPPPLVFASSNKVYGQAFDPARLIEREQRYQPALGERRAVDESWPIEPCCCHGRSKAAADRYVLEHARAHRLHAVVLRMSCLYGPRQPGSEGQGWVAHVLGRALQGQPITILGNGKQVRDLLYVDDAIDACLRARARIAALAGQACNLGGGPDHALSPLELLARLSELAIAAPALRFAGSRPGDPLYYASDTGRFERRTGWRAQTPVAAGLRKLQRWLLANDDAHGGPEVEPAADKVPA